MAAGPTSCRAVIRLVDAAMRQGSTQTMLTDYPLVYAPGNLDNVQVILLDGRPIATAPVLPRYVEGDGFGFGLGVISPTATDPAHQHHGHGSACVAACVRRMEDLGLELSVLWTQVATFPFYERNGWQAVARPGGTHALTRDDAARFARWTGTIARLADHPERIADVVALHRAAGHGVTRSLSEAAALHSLPGMTTWLAMDGARVAATLVDSQAGNKPGLLEAAGDEAAASGLIRHVLQRLAAGTSVALHVGFAPDALDGAARSVLPGRVPAPLPGNLMARLNDPAAFLRRIRGWLEGHTPATRRSASVHVVDAGLTISLVRVRLRPRTGLGTPAAARGPDPAGAGIRTVRRARGAAGARPAGTRLAADVPHPDPGPGPELRLAHPGAARRSTGRPGSRPPRRAVQGPPTPRRPGGRAP